MIYNFTEQQKNKINEHWGDDGDFYRILHYTLEVVTEKWKLYDLEFGEYYSCNAVFFCKSELYGDCVLKINRDGAAEPRNTYNAMNEDNGNRCVRVFENDEWGALLVERAVPGKLLSDKPLEKRLAVFSELFNGRHIAPEKPENFDTYKWDSDGRLLDRRKNNKELYSHALKAKEIYQKMASVYDRRLLIHTDLTTENIASCGGGKYKIVDPFMTVIGDPVFETGKFIFVECCFHSIEPEKAEIVLDYLEKSLNIPSMILTQCLYLEAMPMGEHHSEYDIKRLKFVESLMNKRN